MVEKYADKEIQEYLYGLGFDLKAESFSSFVPNSFILSYNFKDYFDRRIRQDITGIKKDKDTQKEKYEITLSRRSFYNIFPERFFHNAFSSASQVANMSTDYKTRKKEEAKARSFFAPLENEFFAHRITNEKEENRIFESLSSDELVTFLGSIWNTNSRFPKKMAARLLKSIPFIHKISGNLPKIIMVLETILNETVTSTTENLIMPESPWSDNEPQYLGVNFATSMSCKTYLPKYIISVGPIQDPDTIEDYLPEGRIAGVIEFFLNYTLPFESDFQINFCIAQNKQHFRINEENYTGRLGISTTI